MNAAISTAIAFATLLAPQVSSAQNESSAGQKKMTPPPAAAPRPFEFPKYTSRKLANGLTVFVVEDHRQPLVSYSLQIHAGNVNQSPDHSGLASMTAVLLREGTATRTSQEISKLVDNSGGSLSASAGDDTTVVNGSFMKSYADLGIELMSDIVLHPKFDQAEIERQVRQALSGLSVQYNDPEYLRPLLAARAIYGTHPYGYPGDGTPQSLRGLTRLQIAAFHQSWYSPARAFLAISGDVTPEEAFAKAERFFGSWQGESAAPRQLPEPPAPKARVVIIDKPDAVQTQIGVGHIGVPRNHPDYLPLAVASQIFGGSFNSRLNMKLRAKEGLTYGASGRFESDRLAGVFSIGTFTRTDKTAEAIGMIAELVKEWKANPATEAELNEAKAFLIGSYGLGLETAEAVSSRVLTQAVYGLPEDYYPRFRERVAAIDMKTVKSAVERHVLPGQLTIAAVGNAKEFAKALEAFGPVRVIPAAEFDPLAPDMVRVKEKIVTSAEGSAKGKALLENAAAFMGGKDKLLGIKDAIFKGSMKLTTPQGVLDASDAVQTILYPDGFKLSFNIMGMNIVQSSDGKTGYMAQGPQARDVPPDFVREISRSAVTSNGIGLLRSFLMGEAQALALAPVELDGRMVDAVLWKKDDFEVKILLDPASGRILKLAYRSLGMQGPTDTESVFGEPMEAGGLKLPATEIVFQNGQKVLDAKLTSVELNTGVDASVFRKPGQ